MKGAGLEHANQYSIRDTVFAVTKLVTGIDTGQVSAHTATILLCLPLPGRPLVVCLLGDRP